MTHGLKYPTYAETVYRRQTQRSLKTLPKTKKPLILKGPVGPRASTQRGHLSRRSRKPVTLARHA